MRDGVPLDWCPFHRRCSLNDCHLSHQSPPPCDSQFTLQSGICRQFCLLDQFSGGGKATLFLPCTPLTSLSKSAPTREQSPIYHRITRRGIQFLVFLHYFQAQCCLSAPVSRSARWSAATRSKLTRQETIQGCRVRRSLGKL